MNHSIKWSRNSSKRFFKLLAIIVSLVGTISQSFDATVEYLHYYTLTRLTMEPLLDQKIPAIGLCASYEQKTFGNMTILDRLLKTKNVSQVLNHCLVLNGNTHDYVNCLSASKVNEYIDSQLKCYSFFESRSMVQNGTLEFDWISRTLPIFDINITVPESYDLQPLLVIYSPDELLSQKRSYHNKVWLPQDGRTEFTFTYSISKHLLLPAPYGSPCTDYASLGLKSRANALDKCLSQNFVIDGNRLQPYQTFANREASIEDLSIKTINLDEERSLVQSAMKICIEKLAGDDCYHEDYSIEQISCKPGQENQSTIRATLSALPSHVRQNKLEPVTTLIEYINWIGNIFNLWIGFAVCTVSSAAIGFLFHDVSHHKREFRLKIRKTPNNMRIVSSKIYRFNQRIIMMIAIIFATVQTSDIVMIYFDAPFKWNFFAKLQDTVTFPTAVFCVDRVIDGKRMQNLYPIIYNETPESEWDKNLTVNQLLELTFDAADVFDSKRSKFTSRTKMSWDSVEAHFTFKKYINHQHLCFKTFSQDSLVNGSIQLRPYSRSLIELMQYFSVGVKIDAKRMKSVIMVIQKDKLFALEGSRVIQPGSLQSLMFPVNKDLRFQMNKYITYHREMERIFWPNHMASTCFPYRENLGKDRPNLIDVCIKRNIMQSLLMN